VLKVEAETDQKAAIEAEVDADIAAFDAWFQSLPNDPLVRSEKAAIKTYLFYKLRGKVRGA